jgi:hypothetical protein
LFLEKIRGEKKMRKIKFWVLCLIVSLFIFPLLNAQTEGPPPPVDIELTLDESPQPGQEVEVTLTVTAKENMQIDIGLLIPFDLRVKTRKLRKAPYQERNPQKSQRRSKLKKRLSFFAGSVDVNQSKTFKVKVLFPKPGNYIIVAHIVGLTKWDTEEKELEINI